jgi:hypothetical protein
MICQELRFEQDAWKLQKSYDKLYASSIYLALSIENLFLSTLLSPATFLPSGSTLSDFLICAKTKG